MLKPKISPQHAMFIVGVLEGKSQTMAYREAGFHASSDRVAATNANRLMKRADIQAALSAARTASRVQAIITVSDLVSELDEVKRVALAADPPQTGPAAQCVLGKARLLGLLTDKKQLDIVHHKPALSRKELELDESEWKRQFGPPAG